MNPRILLVASLFAAVPLLAAPADEPPSRSPPVAVTGESSVDLAELIAKVHRKTGRQFILDSHVAGRVSLAGLDAERIDYQMLLVILRYNGLVALAEKEVVTILPDAVARQLPMRTLTADDPGIGDETLITRLVQVRNICAAQTVPILRPLMPQYAHLAAYPFTNTLVMTDRADNVRRIADLVERLEKAAGNNKQDCGSSKLSS